MKKVLIAALTGLATVVLLVTSAAAAPLVAPTLVLGNVDLTAPGYDYDVEIKIEPPNAGTYDLTVGGTVVGYVTITTTDGIYFDWESDLPPDVVLVKGGNNTNLYEYYGSEFYPVFSDSDLHAPINPSNGQPFGLSHISFGFNLNPDIDIEKATNGEDADTATGPYVPVGGPVEWTYVVTNPGNLPIGYVVVSDSPSQSISFVGGDADGDNLLDVTETWIYTASGTAAAGQYENIATVTGTSVLDQEVTDSDPSHYFGSDPSIDIEKATNGEDADTATGPYVPVGDQVVWTYVVTNTGNVDLTNVEVNDSVLGLIGTIDSLPVGGVATLTASGSAEAGQYGNLGTATGTPPVGDDVSDEDPSHYFGSDPSIDIEKATNGEDADTATGPYVPVGDQVVWTYVVTNTGNVDLTNVEVNDSVLGLIGTIDSLPVGGVATLTASGSAEAGQYGNLGTATGTPPVGDDVSDEDPSHYFGSDPSIDIEKATNGEDADTATGPYVPVGDQVVWTYVVTNTGNVDLTNVEVNDSVLGLIGTIDSLPVGGVATLTASGSAEAGQYGNLGTATGTPPVGDDVSDEDPSHYFGSDPSIDIEKATNGEDADDPTGPVVLAGSTVTWTYVVTNTGNVDLTNVVVTDDQGGTIGTIASLAAGASQTLTATGTAITGQYANLGTATGTPPVGPDVSDVDPSHYFGEGGAVTVLKTTNGAVNPAVAWTFKIIEGVPGEAGATDVAASSTGGDTDGVLEFDDYNLDPTKTYTLLEVELPAGWATFWQVDLDNDGIPDATVIPYNPDQVNGQDLGNRAIQFGAGTDYPIIPGQTLAFIINNSMPGGTARTPGYWKNWNRITNGGQADNADRNGGYSEGFWLLEDILDPNIGGGIIWDDILDDDFLFVISDAQDAVNILDQRDLDTGKKKANDAAYTLAMHLLAYQLNQAAGAYAPPAEVINAAMAAEELLDELNFDGTGNYLRPKDAQYSDALAWAKILDDYNNNLY